ncbi:hypothetical protein AO064_29305 [Pseudomonas marginalis]|uniref:Uncharacterized protein n=1 Tax=Pseudomonas marginalis TaxID=298 RepID=A0A9X5KPH8_PSEMA|nr:hypothetical protein AO064_29305 [Pseudomonas marginalis]
MCAQQGLQFVAGLEHLLGIGQGPAPGFGQFKLAPDTLKQRDTKGLLEQADLPADRLGREVELLTGAHDAAGLGHHPKVVQLSVIEHDGHHFVKTEVYARKIRIFLNCSSA